MKKVLVSYPQNFNSDMILERYLISSIEDLREYFCTFPERETKEYKENIVRELKEHKTLIVNTFGGYSQETKGIKIVKYL